MAAIYVVAFFELADDDDEEEDEIGLVVVIADVICITPSVSKQMKVEIHRSHFSEEGKVAAAKENLQFLSDVVITEDHFFIKFHGRS
jgi:hypothetical protein